MRVSSMPKFHKKAKPILLIDSSAGVKFCSKPDQCVIRLFKIARSYNIQTHFQVLEILIVSTLTSVFVSSKTSHITQIIFGFSTLRSLHFNLRWLGVISQ